MQICCSFIAVCAIEWVVSTSHIFIEESERTAFISVAIRGVGKTISRTEDD